MLTAAPADPAAAAKKMWTCLILTGAGSAFCFSAALAYPQRPFLSQTTTPNSAWLVVGIILGLINMAITIDLGHRLLERFLRTADR